MRIGVVSAALVAVFLPSLLRAQPVSFTETEALARLSAESPRVRAIRSAVDLARSDVVAAGRWPNPRLTWNRESVAGITENITTIWQPLPVTGRRDLEVQAASRLVDASSDRADEALRRARADLRLAFAQLVAAQNREHELTTAGDRLRALVTVLARREAAGDAAGFDRLRAEREVLDVEADRALASTDRARYQAAVAGFFAEPIDPARILAVSPTHAFAELPALDALVGRAMSTRGELLALRKEAEAADFALSASGRRKIPEPEVGAGTKSSTAAGGNLGGIFVLQASLPLFDHGKAERAAAEARAQQAETRARSFERATTAEIAGLRASVLERRDAAERYRTTAVAGADQIERIAQVSYDAGERGILELLDAHRTGSGARIRQATLDLSVRLAEIELEFASGWEIPS